MGITTKTQRGRRESNLALVEGDNRVVKVNFPLSVVTRYREEAKSRGMTLNEYILALLATRPRLTKKKKQPKR